MQRSLYKEPWIRFSVKVIALLTVLVAAGFAFASRYRIGWDNQKETCLPYHLFLIDLKDQRIKRGAFYAFSVRGLAPIYQDGTTMIKQIVGLPSDRIRIDAFNQITVNTKIVGQGLPLAPRLSAQAAYFQGHMILQSDQYWLMGWHPQSLDSRYFGAIQADQIRGRAYGLL